MTYSPVMTETVVCWVLVHMIKGTARRGGDHTDKLREQIDGSTGRKHLLRGS
ncbi:hypothetical protein ABZ876_12305 [Streptomyces sp. NPDC046931]|uniref:hypothetical protein n=1 Tax=Streptomyces sp. NPDC046931 TaxID=3154806 RepID=UPI0033E9E44A